MSRFFKLKLWLGYILFNYVYTNAVYYMWNFFLKLKSQESLKCIITQKWTELTSATYWMLSICSEA
jgi:hypothetical protein